MPGMSTDTSVRQPKGIPAGGQFAATTHPEPAVGLPAQAPGTDQFAKLMTEDLAGRLDASLKGRIRGKDWYSGSKVDQVFEAELDDEGGLSVYTRNPSSEEGVSYAVGLVDGKPQISVNDDYSPDVKPRDLHPELWAGPDDAVKEISHVILDLEGGATTPGGTPDGFASDADYRRWKEG